MRKIAVVITSRASYSRFKVPLLLLNQSPDIALSLILGASAACSEYGNVPQQAKLDGIPVYACIPVLSSEDTASAMAQNAGRLILELAPLFEKLAPDAVVSIADRYETIATAIAAAYQNIPLVHIQGGEITGNIDEKVRHAVTKLSDLHIVATQRAKQFLVRMGEHAERVFVTGCASCDLASRVMGSKYLDRKMLMKYSSASAFLSIKENEYLIVLEHPVTDEISETCENTKKILKAVARTGKPAVWIRPNADAGANQINRLWESAAPENVIPIRALDNRDFLELLYFSSGIVGNSSVGIRECSFMGVPAVNVGTRQNGRERGKNVIDVNYDEEEIYRAICQMGSLRGMRDYLYGDGNAGERIAKIIATADLNCKRSLNYISCK